MATWKVEEIRETEVRVRGREGGRGGRGRARRRAIISDEIRATVVNHVVNDGLTMQEAGQRVQPNISRFSVASIHPDIQKRE